MDLECEFTLFGQSEGLFGCCSKGSELLFSLKICHEGFWDPIFPILNSVCDFDIVLVMKFASQIEDN